MTTFYTYLQLTPYMAAFRFAWWVMAAITALGLIPLLLLLRWRRAVTAVEPA